MSVPVSPPRVGPYTIVDRPGAGGIGEVYRAHDPTLNRQVAIRFLLPSVTYAVSDDGRRFLMKVPPASGDLTPITVVITWPGALTR